MRHPLHILVVCTANVGRSPVGQRLLQRQLDAVGVPAIVRSAGTAGGHVKVHRNTKSAAEAIGLSLDDHVPRRLRTDLLAADGADLVVAMTREHLYTIVVKDKHAFRRSFTLPELSRRVGLLAGVEGLGFPGWLDALNRRRSTNDLMPGRVEDDVLDPYGQPRRAHVAMVAELDGLIQPIVASLAAAWGATGAPPTEPVGRFEVSDKEREIVAALIARKRARSGSALPLPAPGAAAPLPPPRPPLGPITIKSPETN